VARSSSEGKSCNRPSGRPKCVHVAWRERRGDIGRPSYGSAGSFGAVIPVSDSLLQPILAMIGHPVAGNPTQYMIEKAFGHHQLDWRYLSLDVAPEDLATAVRGMRAMGFAGGNCSDPHKQAILQHLDRNGQTAELSGVVNFFVRKEDQLVGENTEGKAVLQTLARRIDPAGKQVVILGAGRIARAIAVEAVLAKAAQVTIVCRNEEAGNQLVELLIHKLQANAVRVPWEGPFEVPAETQVLINATSIGEGDAEVPITLDHLSEESVVVDVTPNSPRTWLVHRAEEHGCPVIDGLEIFVEQAAINFKLWTEIEPDRTVMYEAAEEFLEL
jgi:shikimate dehydrogenase